MKISKKWLKMAEIYRLFYDKSLIDLDSSDKAKEEAYLYESKGFKNNSTSVLDICGVFASLENLNKKINAYTFGKWLKDLTVSMWKEDLQSGTMFIGELYNDYPSWWLDEILNIEKNKHISFIGYKNET
jgi:hypothetical protein